MRCLTHEAAARFKGKSWQCDACVSARATRGSSVRGGRWDACALWAEEARRLTASEGVEGELDGAVYDVSGHKAALWSRAAEAEREAVVLSFRRNVRVERVEMSNAM
eukprot:5462873-Pleurochrysis_carterae.AAC.1